MATDSTEMIGVECPIPLRGVGLTPLGSQMIGVECPIPLRGVGLTLLGSQMIGVSTVQGEEFQLTPESQASTRGPLSCKGWSTETELIEVHSTEMYPQAVECMFLVLNVSAELSEP